MVENTSMQIKLEIKKNYQSYKIIIGICVILYLVKEFLINKTGDETSVLIFLGADYKTFTLGFSELFRLITCGFLHSSLLHLICNMYSLFVLGRFLEYIYGTKKFLLFLFSGILFGSLTNGILTSNTIAIGLSGGLYTLMTIMILDLILFRRINISALFITLFLNVSINFMPNVSWQGHLGGAFVGVILFFAEYFNKIGDDKKYLSMYITIAICLCLLFTKYITTKKDIKYYVGTDIQYTSFLENKMHLSSLSEYYSDKIYKYYFKEVK